MLSENIDFVKAIEKLYGSRLLRNEPMEAHTTFRVGGGAAFFVTPSSLNELADTLLVCKEFDVPYYILGNGSNILVSDKGYDGLIIRLYNTMDQMEFDGEIVTAGCGLMLSRLANEAKNRGLSGLEFASGIPGTLGGAVFMNAGAYGGEMKDVIIDVQVMDRAGRIRTVKVSDMDFGYRKSILGATGEIAVSARMSLNKKPIVEIEEIMRDLNGRRREKQPLEYPSAGSTFKRPEGYFAGKLIEDSGLRGFRIGDAMVSTKHCGFVINAGKATADDIKQLIDHIREKVLSDSGVELSPEVRLLGEF